MAVSEYGENVTNGMYQRFTQCGYKQIVVLRTYVSTDLSAVVFLRFHSIKVVIYLSYQFNSISRFRDGRGMGQFLFLIIYAG